MQAAHPSDDGPVLDVHAKCTRCGYDLLGQRVLGPCPECGLAVVTTLAQSADAEVAYLAMPDRPVDAANALVAATVAPLVALLLQASGPALRVVVALAGRGSSFPSQVERPSWLVAGLATGAASILVARGLGEQRNPTVRAALGAGRVRLLTGSLGAWSVALLAGFGLSLGPMRAARSWTDVVLAAQLLPAAIALVTLSPVIARLGALSRPYREARHGRQSADLVSVTLVAGVTLLVALPALRGIAGEEAALVGSIVAAFLWIITLLGLAYLVANGWVVAQALRRPRIDPRRFR